MTVSGGSGPELVAAAEGWRRVCQELCKQTPGYSDWDGK